MLYTMIGVFGFVCFLLFDLLSLRQHVLGKYVFLLLGIGLIGYASFHLIAFETSFVIPYPIRMVSLILAVMFTLLLVFSVFIEVGLNTYEPQAKPHLVTSGTYGLVRHPGVIWLFLAYGFAALFFSSWWLLITAVVWTFVNTLYIVLQERLVLQKLFLEYDKYVSSTPMVIPTFASVRRFIGIQNWRRE